MFDKGLVRWKKERRGGWGGGRGWQAGWISVREGEEAGEGGGGGEEDRGREGDFSQACAETWVCTILVCLG